MANFYVNTVPQAGGEHEVHLAAGCPYPAHPENRRSLGWHDSCHDAVAAARLLYAEVDGCRHCCPACHTR